MEQEPFLYGDAPRFLNQVYIINICSTASASIEPPPYTNDMEPCDRPPTGDGAPWVQFTIPSANCEDRVEEIYEDLCYVKFTSAMPEVAYISHFSVDLLSGCCSNMLRIILTI